MKRAPSFGNGVLFMPFARRQARKRRHVDECLRTGRRIPGRSCLQSAFRAERRKVASSAAPRSFPSPPCLPGTGAHVENVTGQPATARTHSPFGKGRAEIRLAGMRKSPPTSPAPPSDKDAHRRLVRPRPDKAGTPFSPFVRLSTAMSDASRPSLPKR